MLLFFITRTNRFLIQQWYCIVVFQKLRHPSLLGRVINVANAQLVICKRGQKPLTLKIRPVAMNVLVLFFALAKFSGILFRLIYFSSINYELKKHAGWVEKILPKTIWIFTRETAVTICMQFCHFFLFDFSYSVSTPHNTNVAGALKRIKLSIFFIQVHELRRVGAFFGNFCIFWIDQNQNFHYIRFQNNSIQTNHSQELDEQTIAFEMSNVCCVILLRFNLTQLLRFSFCVLRLCSPPLSPKNTQKLK